MTHICLNRRDRDDVLYKRIMNLLLEIGFRENIFEELDDGYRPDKQQFEYVIRTCESVGAPEVLSIGVVLTSIEEEAGTVYLNFKTIGCMDTFVSMFLGFKTHTAPNETSVIEDIISLFTSKPTGNIASKQSHVIPSGSLYMVEEYNSGLIPIYRECYRVPISQYVAFGKVLAQYKKYVHDIDESIDNKRKALDLDIVSKIDAQTK